MIVTDSDSLPHNRTSFIRAMGGLVEQTNERTTSLQSVAERITDMKVCCLSNGSLYVVSDSWSASIILDVVD